MLCSIYQFMSDRRGACGVFINMTSNCVDDSAELPTQVAFGRPATAD
jgi:hypothetical protein